MTRGIPIKRQEEEKTLLMARYYMPGGDIATVLDRSRESAFRAAEPADSGAIPGG